VDESAVVPRGVIPLLGADIVDSADKGGAARVAVNGSHDHSQLVIEPRHREKAFTLASERTGSAGRRDIQAWVQVLSRASRTAEVKAVHQQQRQQHSDVTVGAVPNAASLVLPGPPSLSPVLDSPGREGGQGVMGIAGTLDSHSEAGATAAAEGGTVTSLAGTATSGGLFSARMGVAVLAVVLAVLVALATSEVGSTGSGAAACGRLAGTRVLEAVSASTAITAVECLAHHCSNLLKHITAQA